MRCKIFVLLFLLSTASIAQQEGIYNLPRFDSRLLHFGFTIGFNQMDFTLKRTKFSEQKDSILNISTQGQFGFQIAIVSDLKIGNNLNLRFTPGLSFGDRKVNYDISKTIYDINTPLNDTVLKVTKTSESTFLDFPLLLKFKTNRITNFRAYALLGGKYSYDLASQSKKKQEDEEFLKLLPHDYSLEVGTGVEWYLEYFKFGVEIRMSYGFPDMLKREGTIYTNNIDRLSSKIWWLCFTFE
ncbi:MAG: PorT family protein [Bacteroidales bacterium]|nr:PorT family protein [Bacteroidales bacterium]